MTLICSRIRPVFAGVKAVQFKATRSFTKVYTPILATPTSYQKVDRFSASIQSRIQRASLSTTTVKMSSPTIKLNNGASMPQVGFGLWKVDGNVAADVVYNAIKAGYRAFDGACDYGNEVECGKGVARAISEGLVKREDLFIISKLWNSFHDAERVEPIVRKQLGDWGIDYFDLYYIHFPVAIEYVDPSVRYPPGWWSGNESDKQIRPGKSTLQETWHAIEALVPAGLSKSIGISNYTGALLLDLLVYAKTKPQALQIEHHPYYVSKDLTHLAKINDIAVVGYSSFGPQSFVDCDMQLAKDIPLLFDHEVIKKIADKHGKTPAQVLLRWATQRGIAVIPKSATESRLKQNLDVTGWDLAESDISEISALDLRLKFNSPPNYGLPCYVFA